MNCGIYTRNLFLDVMLVSRRYWGSGTTTATKATPVCPPTVKGLYLIAPKNYSPLMGRGISYIIIFQTTPVCLVIFMTLLWIRSVPIFNASLCVDLL